MQGIHRQIHTIVWSSPPAENSVHVLFGAETTEDQPSLTQSYGSTDLLRCLSENFVATAKFILKTPGLYFSHVKKETGYKIRMNLELEKCVSLPSILIIITMDYASFKIIHVIVVRGPFKQCILCIDW